MVLSVFLCIIILVLKKEVKIMANYKVSWKKGRRIGAIGILYPDSIIVHADNELEARLKAYETHENLMFVSITELNEKER